MVPIVAQPSYSEEECIKDIKILLEVGCIYLFNNAFESLEINLDSNLSEDEISLLKESIGRHFDSESDFKSTVQFAYYNQTRYATLLSLLFDDISGSDEHKS